MAGEQVQITIYRGTDGWGQGNLQRWTVFPIKRFYIKWRCPTEQAAQDAFIRSKQSSGTIAGIQTLQSDRAMSASILVNAHAANLRPVQSCR